MHADVFSPRVLESLGRTNAILITYEGANRWKIKYVQMGYRAFGRDGPVEMSVEMSSDTTQFEKFKKTKSIK